MIIDSVADLITRIRNGYLARLSRVGVPNSRMKRDILRILKKNDYIVDFKETSEGRELEVVLHNVRVTKYVPSFKRISRPGQRIYIKASDIKKSRSGLGIYIVSTPKGVVTGYEARALGVGGELLCEVY